MHHIVLDGHEHVTVKSTLYVPNTSLRGANFGPFFVLATFEDITPFELTTMLSV